MNQIIDLMKDHPAYRAELEAMHARMMEWRKANPTKAVDIFWKIGEGVVVVATIRQAIKLGFVHLNEAGFEMVRAMCEPCKDEPTLNMVRAAIELHLSQQ